ncbi:MAG: ATP-dependent helicase, partial [Glaciihabitans sp.]|nr:ATP-dependent helicase [Glaciihabitans sp.]
RGAVVSEGIRGGFALAYKVLSTFEETGRARRGYFVDGLGGAQFATGATVDRLRNFSRDDDTNTDPNHEPVALTLAATDPANPYGAALAWPGQNDEDQPGMVDAAASQLAVETGDLDSKDKRGSLVPQTALASAADEKKKAGHRPGRKAGALVVMVDGFLTLYIERGGKTVLTFTQDEKMLAAAAVSLAGVVRSGLGKLRIERVDGEFSVGTPLGRVLVDAGFAATPQGVRLRA